MTRSLASTSCLLVWLTWFLACGTAEPVRGAELAVRNSLFNSDGEEHDQFGSAVAIFGRVAVVGVPGDDDDGSASGSARVYRFDGESWIAEQKLTAAEPSELAWFGAAVAAAGGLVAVGAENDQSSGLFLAGSVSIFRFDGSTWVEEQRLEAGDIQSPGRFGSSVSVRDDAVLIGSRTADERVGAAYVFRFDGSEWNEEAKITAFDGRSGDSFGEVVCLGDDMAIIGAPYDDIPGAGNAGSVHVYRYDGSQWVFAQKITSPNQGLAYYFGTSVAMHGDVLFVGSYGEETGGACYIYRWDGSQWDFAQRIAPAQPELNSRFEFDVDVWGDTAVVGASLHDQTGVVFVYRYDGTAWQLFETITPPGTGETVLFGEAVALHGDLGIVGAPRIETFTGAAYGLAPACRAGTVNALLTVQNVLRVNGEFGGEDRKATIRFDDALEVSMDVPPLGPSPAPFVLYAWPGEPSETTHQLQPHGIGTTCFPTPLLGGFPPPSRIWNNLGREPELGAPDHVSEPAPSVVVSLPGGLGRTLTVSLQGFIKDRGSKADLPVSITNLVTLSVQ